MVNTLHHGKHWLTPAGSGSCRHYLKDGKFGTFMLMSPMLMFLGISGRFMFFTADTARAGAPAIPAYTHTKHPRRVEKTENSLRINTTNDHTQYDQQHNNAQNKVLTKCKSTDGYSDRQNVHSDAFIASNAHALFGSIMVYITTRAN